MSAFSFWQDCQFDCWQTTPFSPPCLYNNLMWVATKSICKSAPQAWSKPIHIFIVKELEQHFLDSKTHPYTWRTWPSYHRHVTGIAYPNGLVITHSLPLHVFMVYIWFWTLFQEYFFNPWFYPAITKASVRRSKFEIKSVAGVLLHCASRL